MKKNLTDSDLIDSIAAKAKITKRQANSLLDSLADTITDALKRGESVRIPNLGIFSRVPLKKPRTTDDFYEEQREQEKESDRKTNLKLIAAVGKKKKPKEARTSAKRYITDPNVAVYAKRQAGGKCQLCTQPAPFNYGEGDPYLEVHHIVWLAKGGEDTPQNAVALCPNCHRKMHILDREGDKRTLCEKAKQTFAAS